MQALSGGADRIDRDALPPGCVLCNVRGHERTMAEWVLMAMLALHRRLLSYDRDLRDGIWRREDRLPKDLGEGTLAVIGLGAIGERVAEVVRCLGMRTIGVTRAPTPERAVAAGLGRLAALGELPSVLAEADVAVVCLPLRPETEGLVGIAELDALGRDGLLVNVARGAVVDEEALYEALRDGRIAGAALDVWYRYPERGEERTLPATQPFWELDNVLMTPHVSGRSESTRRRRWEFVAAQLRRFAAGEPLENVVRNGV